jgi:hypothetical protein
MLLRTNAHQRRGDFELGGLTAAGRAPAAQTAYTRIRFTENT